MCAFLHGAMPFLEPAGEKTFQFDHTRVVGAELRVVLGLLDGFSQDLKYSGRATSHRVGLSVKRESTCEPREPRIYRTR